MILCPGQILFLPFPFFVFLFRFASLIFAALSVCHLSLHPFSIPHHASQTYSSAQFWWEKESSQENSWEDSGNPSNPQNEAPLHSLLGGSDNQPLSKLNRPRPKGSTKKKRGKHIFLESDDPLEKNIVDKSPMPDGYVFVPKGDVYITRNCRIKTKESDQMVYSIWDKAGKRSFGIRVPSSIHSEVLKTAAATAESRAKAVKTNDTKVLSRGRQLLRSEFPLIPAATLDIVMNHAFLKGSGRVGRTGMTTDKRKASLAVEAHIRHTHTPYDSLLDGGMERSDARKKVWPTVKAIKKSWESGGDVKGEGEQCENREGSVSVSVISISSSSLRAESVLSVESVESMESMESVSAASMESLEWI